MAEYLALLRGINVGGRNLIKMAELRACFEENGFENVGSYIQSGNVLFSAPASASLVDRAEAMLSETFGYQASVVVLSRKQLRAIVDGVPEGFGTDPGAYRYDVIFLKEPLTAKDAIESVAVAPGVDEVSPGPGALYFSRLVSQASRSRLSRIVSSPIYPSVTIRNWNTTTKLLAMLEDR
jgi:uncharacterized protein (DUF1697 family)